YFLLLILNPITLQRYTLKATIPPIYPFDFPQLVNFAEFIYYEGLFLPHEIERVNDYWQAEQKIDAPLSGEASSKEELRKSSVIFLPPDEKSQWIYDKLGMVGLQCNNQRYFFNINGFYQELQLAEYGEGDFFNWHLDFGAGEISHRKLSISVQLTDESEYEGGDLQFMVNQNIVTAPKKKGTVIIFPSFILHRVTPITKGKRKSIVGWISGPPYR
ncbi:MAG: 2OG-Fe(II) oxygenase, partial [Saprospiraceae bacterium]